MTTLLKLISHPHNLLGRSAAARTHSLDHLHNVHSLNDLSKHNVLSIQMRTGNGGNEKLRSVRVGTRVGHAEESRTRMVVDERLIIELPSVNALASSSILQID